MNVPIILPNEKQVLRIYVALSINEDRHQRKLKAFKDWLRSEPHLPDDVDDSYLSQFLRLCKDDLVKAKVKFEANIIIRKSLFNSKHFLTYKSIQQYEGSTQIVISPKPTEDGYRIVFGQLPVSAKDFDFNTMLKYIFDLADITMGADITAGQIIVGDLANCSMEIAMKIDPRIITQIVNFLVNGLPTRIKNYHILNLPAVAKPILAVAKAGMPEKMKNRIVIHNNAHTLKKYIAEDFLPLDYGGKLPTLMQLGKIWEKYYLENEDWKRKVGKLRLTGEVPKEKRHLDPSSGFGIDGTFRNLQVD